MGAHREKPNRRLHPARPKDVAPAKVAKISVSVPPDELRWAQARAKRERSTVSAVIADALREQRQMEAWNEFVEWALDGRTITEAERREAEKELWG